MKRVILFCALGMMATIVPSSTAFASDHLPDHQYFTTQMAMEARAFLEQENIKDVYLKGFASNDINDSLREFLCELLHFELIQGKRTVKVHLMPRKNMVTIKGDVSRVGEKLKLTLNFYQPGKLDPIQTMAGYFALGEDLQYKLVQH